MSALSSGALSPGSSSVVTTAFQLLGNLSQRWIFIHISRAEFVDASGRVVHDDGTS